MDIELIKDSLVRDVARYQCAIDDDNIGHAEMIRERMIDALMDAGLTQVDAATMVIDLVASPPASAADIMIEVNA